MRIAVLILAHKNQQQLNLLIERLQPDFDIYIHLDKKSSLSSECWEKYGNVFCYRKYNINWGSYNSILATLDLFRDAARKNYDYYLHISGQDLPIKSNKEIITFLKNNQDKSFMDWHLLPAAMWGKSGGFGRLIYFWEHNLENKWYNKGPKLMIRLTREIQIRCGLKRKLPDMRFYGGSNWVNLNRDAVEYLIEYINKNPSFLTIFKYSVNADEIWMQTILKQSDLPFDSNYLRYVDWSDGPKSPRTLTMSELKKIKESDGLFARKFDEGVDKEIIYKILALSKE
ncbi:MAG: beta-1,6-N-acetylglucosaminyltransferase [Candidatus Azobacteroides sp.]|nr:beta-1,6-N-acetylglucosaminyltransferase [Candidatus Azobacteroides sp.]